MNVFTLEKVTRWHSGERKSHGWDGEQWCSENESMGGAGEDVGLYTKKIP